MTYRHPYTTTFYNGYTLISVITVSYTHLDVYKRQHWNKRNYLKAVKVGSKVKYRLSDVKRILGGTNKTVSDGSK